MTIIKHVDLADLDVIMLTYDEPNAEEHWADLLNKVPWAQRVHGVEGSDAAHKAAAALSSTDRFITVDGDNIIDTDFFNNVLHVEGENQVFSWKSHNAINGLTYGNGGLKCWPKHVVETMKTHEAADPNNLEAQVEFCWGLNYIQMYNSYSVNYQNGSDYQAWRAGFREGVKMCLVNGSKLSMDAFKNMPRRNRQHLEIWLNIGTDVKNGMAAICGAREGIRKTMFTDWNFIEVRDFKAIKRIYDDYDWDMAFEQINAIMEDLRHRLNLDILTFTDQQSSFFKRYSNQHYNKDFNLTEMDYIRAVEKW